MPKIVKSIRGATVDFDLIKIKNEIQSSPTPLEVAERREYIDNKLQRRIRRAKLELQKNNLSKPEKGQVDVIPPSEEEEKPKPKSKTRVIKKGRVDDTSIK